jgi:hypothetical protein
MAASARFCFIKARAPRDEDGAQHWLELLAEEKRVGVRLGEVRGGDRGERHVRGDKGGRIVQSVADHENAAALRFQKLDVRDFFGRRQAGAPMFDAKLLRDRRDSGRPVAGEHNKIKSALAQCVRHRPRRRIWRCPGALPCRQ